MSETAYQPNDHNPDSSDCAFETPVELRDTSVGTVGEATHIVRERLQSQFKVATLNALLMLERAAVGSEIAQARDAFADWARSERLV